MAIGATLLILAAITSALKFQWRLKRSHHVQSIRLGRRTVNLYKNDEIRLPLSTGIFRGKIFVPPAWDSWSNQCRNLILAHEMGHLKRRDSLVQALQIFALACYWFHPFVWILNRKLNEFREMACDDMSIQASNSTSLVYSRYLVKIAEGTVKSMIGCSTASALIGRKHKLLKRIKYQLKEDTMISKKRIRLVSAALLLLILSLSWNLTGAKAEKPDSRNKSIRIDVKSEREIIIKGQTTTLADFEQSLKKIMGDVDEKTVFRLKLDKAVTMNTINQLHRMLVEKDLLKIKYESDNRQNTGLMLPLKDAKAKLDKIPAKNIAVVYVDASGGTTIDGAAIAESDFLSTMKQRLSKNKLLVIKLQTHQDTLVGDYINVLNRLKDAGAQRICVGDE
ncbi:hypothetical protein JXJ21_09095 [candidate division KSB1 bacterium]|nr:hypothetical protein [candidate division KSB1 bacterium]